MKRERKREEERRGGRGVGRVGKEEVGGRRSEEPEKGFKGTEIPEKLPCWCLNGRRAGK